MSQESKAPAVRVMQVIFGLLALQFILPSLSYLFTPDIALAQANQLNQLLGGAPLDLQRERGDLFRVLGFSNVFTLGVLCALLAWDVRQNRALIPVFVVLKGGSALGYLYTFLLGPTRPPLFLTAFFWDGLAVFLVVFFSRRGLKALGTLDPREPPPR